MYKCKLPVAAVCSAAEPQLLHLVTAVLMVITADAAAQVQRVPAATLPLRTFSLVLRHACYTPW